MTPEKLKQRRRDRVQRVRNKAADEETAKLVQKLCEGWTPIHGMSLTPLAMVSATIGGIALAACIAMLIEHGVI